MVPSTSSHQATRIAFFNDAFRSTFIGGTICVTAGINMLGDEFIAKALAAVKSFSSFGDDNDPHGEHDFGSLEIDGRTLFWKIDYYEPNMVHGSEDPSNEAITRRVLTVMLAEEY